MPRVTVMLVPTDMEQQTRPRTTLWTSVKKTLDTSVHLIIVLVCSYVIWLTVSPYRQMLTVHAILGCLGILMLMSASIMIFSDNTWYSSLPRKTKVWMHGITLGIACLFIIVACNLEYYRKASKKGHGHFNSIHGVTALVTTILVIVSGIIGLANANSDWFRSNVYDVRPVKLKSVHNFVGHVAYLLGMYALTCGFYSNWFVSHSDAATRATLCVLVLFVAVSTLRKAFVNLYIQCGAVY